MNRNLSLHALSYEVASQIPVGTPKSSISIVSFASTLLDLRRLPVTSDKDKR